MSLRTTRYLRNLINPGSQKGIVTLPLLIVIAGLVGIIAGTAVVRRGTTETFPSAQTIPSCELTVAPAEGANDYINVGERVNVNGRSTADEAIIKGWILQSTPCGLDEREDYNAGNYQNSIEPEGQCVYDEAGGKYVHFTIKYQDPQNPSQTVNTTCNKYITVHESATPTSIPTPTLPPTLPPTLTPTLTPTACDILNPSHLCNGNLQVWAFVEKEQNRCDGIFSSIDKKITAQNAASSEFFFTDFEREEKRKVMNNAGSINFRNITYIPNDSQYNNTATIVYHYPEWVRMGTVQVSLDPCNNIRVGGKDARVNESARTISLDIEPDDFGSLDNLSIPFRFTQKAITTPAPTQEPVPTATPAPTQEPTLTPTPSGGCISDADCPDDADECTANICDPQTGICRYPNICTTPTPTGELTPTLTPGPQCTIPENDPPNDEYADSIRNCSDANLLQPSNVKIDLSNFDNNKATVSWDLNGDQTALDRVRAFRIQILYSGMYPDWPEGVPTSGILAGWPELVQIDDPNARIAEDVAFDPEDASFMRTLVNVTIWAKVVVVYRDVNEDLVNATPNNYCFCRTSAQSDYVTAPLPTPTPTTLPGEPTNTPGPGEPTNTPGACTRFDYSSECQAAGGSCRGSTTGQCGDGYEPIGIPGKGTSQCSSQCPGQQYKGVCCVPVSQPTNTPPPAAPTCVPSGGSCSNPDQCCSNICTGDVCVPGSGRAPTPTPQQAPPFEKADVDGDGAFTARDADLVQRAYDPLGKTITPEGAPEDIDSNGVVNGRDISIAIWCINNQDECKAALLTPTTSTDTRIRLFQ